MRSTPFADRRDAGRQLAAAVARLRLPNPVVLALPRGGVPVGFEVARRLGAPLDVLIVRKIGAPGNQEYGIGAIVDGGEPIVVIDREAARRAGASPAYLEEEEARQRTEIARRRALYGVTAPASLNERSVVVVDDGIATGATARAALVALRKAHPARLVLAVPLSPRSALEDLARLCDETVCLQSPDPFYAVGAHYADFDQTTDAEVINLLRSAQADERSGGATG